ncbi:iron ABC transporter permease [Devosia sp.]|uniref:FecCD family ABC transporter permease n=1 Tax=Devosia sp. TaxID=1871048 RepID=UPI0025E2460E|nr:iron ABC transporter permease [Devosia sp.]MCR6634227.1 iron ABC transporter permease [Devosia sp.]
MTDAAVSLSRAPIVPLKMVLTIGLIVLPIVLAVVALCLGRYMVAPGNALSILLNQVLPIEPHWEAVEETVVLNIRLPRVLMALLIGGGLAVSGAAFQGLFGNPLVSPHILGVSSGAGFGAALTILIFRHMTFVPAGALVFGIAAMMVALWISRRGGRSSLFMLILGGVITAAMFEALLSLLKYVADPNDTLPTIVYWLMGSLTSSSYDMLAWGVPLIAIGSSVLWALRWRLNIMSLSEVEARSLGTDVQKMRWVVIVAATLVTATTVSLAGIIGWVGLVIPHVARMLVGSNHSALIPASISIGAMYLLVIDTVARTATSAEIPLSILTAIIGAPFFAYLLKRAKGGWS